MRLVLIGAPGSGKGTQSALLCRHYGIPHLSTGEILREAKRLGTPLGKRVAPIMDSGGLVDDALMLEVVRERLLREDCLQGFLLDGFPRTLPQSNDLDRLLGEFGWPLTAVIELQVSLAELERRLINRYHEMENPRPEDQPDAISKRLDLFEKLTKPILDHYRAAGLLHSIDGMRTPDEVFNEVRAVLSAHVGNT
ncbi:MAG TPA: adenylate kinase [Pirellulaceae bacterium]|nr:adenylate kinase [Pirellulaceae bacterium]